MSESPVTMSDDKPPPMPVIAENIPVTLRECAQWVGWNWHRNGAKWDKPPLDVRTGRKCSKTDPAAWCSFDEALAAHQQGRFDGIGFCFTLDDPFVGIDLDDCRDPKTGELNEFARWVLPLLGSYVEVSPSGCGLKFIGLGSLDRNYGSKGRGVELYDRGAYFTVTGHIVDNSPCDVRDIEAGLTTLVETVFPPDHGIAPEHFRDAAEGTDRELALSALRGLSVSRAGDYREWVRIGMALHAVDPSLSMLDEWDGWSRSCPEKYQEGVCRKKWESFNTGRNRAVGLGTLIHLAKQDGWKRPRFDSRRNGNGTVTAHHPAVPAKPSPCAEVLQWKPFPVDALPDIIGRYTRDAAKAIGCDPSYVALPLIAGLGGAIGISRMILLKAGWAEPAVVWSVIVGDSGTLKSPAVDAPLRAIRKRQDDAFLKYQKELADYETTRLQHETAVAEWKKRSKSKLGTNEPPPDAPKEPVCERFWVSDTTIEALADRLKHAPRGLLLSRDELAGWVQSFDQYKGGRGGDVAHWLTLHGARDLLVDRKNGGATFVPHAAVSITGGIQPETLRRVLAREHYENGLMARLLLSMPSCPVKRWTEAEISEELQAELGELFDRLYALQPNYDASERPIPVVLPLTRDAKVVWVKFYNQHAREQAGLSGDEAAAWSKLEGYCARLALILQLCIDPAATAIGAHAVQAAITLSRWFGHEARRVYAVLVESDGEREQRRLIELITRHDGAITPSQLQAADRRYRSDSSAAEEALNKLKEAGLGRWEEKPPGPKGGRPSKVFRLTPPVSSQSNPENVPDSEGFADADTGDTAENGGIDWTQ